MNADKMKQLSDLIKDMDIKEVMNVVNNDDRVLMLNWFYPSHIAAIWGSTTEVIEPQMDDIKRMFSKVEVDGGFSDIDEQVEYLEEWNIKIN